MSDAFIDRYEITDDGWHKKAEYGPWVKFSDHAAALRAANERAEKMRPVYEAACHYMSDPSPATKEALLRAWREDAALRDGEWE